MKWLSAMLIVLLLGSLLIIGCGGGSSSFTDTREEEGTIDNDRYLGEASSIDFISATPKAIALKNTGGPPRSETSVLVFMVVDEYGNPVPNQTVNFKLSTELGGLSLSNTNDVSDSAGLVRVTVNAGNVSTNVMVHASLNDTPSITIVSDTLVVSTGLPDQNSISLFSKIVEIKPDEWDYGKAEFDIVFQAADHFNNFVPDGTVVYFTTEGGSIDGSAETKFGGCKVKWRSGNPVPDDEAITILAFCVGEESFIDFNGNGYFDEGDLFDESTDMAEPFRDDNENGVHDIGEEYWDYNNNGKFDGVPNGIYNGSLCSDEAEALGICTKELVYVRKSITLMKADVEGEWSAEKASSIDFISSCPKIIALKGTGGPARSETSVLVFMTVDKYGNPVPNQIVNFKLSTDVGGLSLSNESAVSSSEGLVQVTVNAGNMSTHIRVHATLDDNPSITVVSDELVVYAGLPDQNSISLFSKIVEIKPDEWDYGKSEFDIVFQAADHFNNFVPDGTVVYFTTEGGSIGGSAITRYGGCKVKWRSGNPVPDDEAITILAFCVGEESFTDVNGNGFFDTNDRFDEDTDLAEPFRDDNENGVYDIGEEYWDYNNNGKFDGVPNGIYNGSLCSDEAEALGICTKELVYVRKSITLLKADVQGEWSGEKASSIDFISSCPKTIALKGTGGPARSETSVLVFMTVDKYGNPVPNQIVNFKLSTEIGGLSLSNKSAVSNSEGLVQVTVNAGNVSTHVRVHATLDDNPLVTVVSDELAVSTGLPDQNSISLSAETLNPEGWHYNNIEVPIIFQAADLFNNFVPNGTVVYFTTEGGSIIASSTIQDGVCEVTWRSGEPRPDDGLFTILAFCIGEESFTDVNGNGFFDEEDWFDEDTDLAEPFRDDNGNGDYDYGEWFWDYNYNGEFDANSNGIYNGTLCSDDAEALGLCTKELVYVQNSISLIMSGSFANIDFSLDSVDLTGGASEVVFISIADLNNNPMPYNTKIDIKTTNGNFADGTQAIEFKVPNTNLPGPLVYTVTLMPSEEDGPLGILQVEVTTPFENVSAASIDVEDDN